MNSKIDELKKQADQNRNESSFSSAERNFANANEAARVFSILKTKLQNIEEWNDHGLLSSFRLFDENGNALKNEPLPRGAFIQISLKGSGKYDWVRVTDIYEAADEFIITVKPTFDPTEENPDKSVVSHFFTDEATNNFCVLRKNSAVELCVIGLNEKQNTGETKNALETVRNVAVNLGTYLGVQKTEWEKFCNDFLESAANKV
jgi:hypothetical protein